MRKTLIRNTKERTVVTYPYAYWDNGFTTEELDGLETYLDSFDMEKALTVGYKGNDEQLKETRRCKVRFHKSNEETEWIFKRLDMIITNINDQFYNFDLNGYESFQYTRYSAEDAGTYNWHMDMFTGSDFLPEGTIETRKLSLTLLLNDQFTGGDFCINSGREEHPKVVPCPRGRAIIFPSFMIHKVTPLLTGMRKSVVVWVTGPKFK
jgi:PKHD-type hydroxylase